MAKRNDTNSIIKPASLPSDSIQAEHVPFHRPERTMTAKEAIQGLVSGIKLVEDSLQATKRELVVKFLIPNVVTGEDLEAATNQIKLSYDSPVRRAEFGAILRACVKSPEQVMEYSTKGWNDFVDACRKLAPSGNKAASTTSENLSTKKVEKILEDLESKGSPAQLAKVAESLAEKVTEEAALEKMIESSARKLQNAEAAIKLAALILEVAAGLTEQEAPQEAIQGAKMALDEFLDIRDTLALEASQATDRNAGLVVSQPEQ